jgi:hypothetical protein
MNYTSIPGTALKPASMCMGSTHIGTKIDQEAALSFLMFKIGNHLVCHFDRREKSLNTVSCKQRVAPQ